jgi:hypothetical protein
MKNIFVVALFLISIFLIGNAEAVAENGDCREFLVNITTAPDYALPTGSWQECVAICPEGDGFVTAHTWCGEYQDDTLHLISEDLGMDTKNLVGYSEVFSKTCHVQIKRNLLEADCYLNMFGGVKIHARGVASTDCPCDEK